MDSGAVVCVNGGQSADVPGTWSASLEWLVGRLAPRIPDRLGVESLRGKRLAVFHGALDRSWPGLPGVSPASSRRGFERARSVAREAEYTLIPGALHGVAFRARNGSPVPLPRARR